MGPSSGNPTSKKTGILHWQGCKTCLPELKWQLQTKTLDALEILGVKVVMVHW